MSYPIGNYRFFVSLDPADAYAVAGRSQLPPAVAIGGFSDVTGLSGELEVLAQPEGGQNTYVHQLGVRYNWGRLTLKHGIGVGTSLWDWFAAGLSGTAGARRDGSIILIGADGAPAVAWEFRAGLAAKWTGPELNAREGAVAIESLEIVHQGLEQVSLATSLSGAI
jgi:phage tail-like protein